MYGSSRKRAGNFQLDGVDQSQPHTSAIVAVHQSYPASHTS